MFMARPRAFTLLELAAVLAIIGLLVSVSVGTYDRHVRAARAQEAVFHLYALADRLAAQPGGPVACAASPPEVPRGGLGRWIPSAGFRALDWSPGPTTRYQYEVLVPGGEGPAFIVRARGDLDGDGLTSVLDLRSDERALRVVRGVE